MKCLVRNSNFSTCVTPRREGEIYFQLFLVALAAATQARFISYSPYITNLGRLSRIASIGAAPAPVAIRRTIAHAAPNVIAKVAVEMDDPCQPDPCGENAECTAKDNRAVRCVAAMRRKYNASFPPIPA